MGGTRERRETWEQCLNGVAQAGGGAGFSQVWKAHPNRTEAEPRAQTQAGVGQK